MVTGHIRGLDGLRAFAALSVFVYHLWGRLGYPAVAISVAGLTLSLDRALSNGAGGVSLFFALSGFLLSQPFWAEIVRASRPVDVRRYVKRRILRIYPAYVVIVIICVLFYDIEHPLSIRLINLVTHLLLIHNFSEVTIFNVSTPLWSVATEFQLYLMLPIIFVLLRRLPIRLKQSPFSPIAVFLLSGVVGLSVVLVLTQYLQTFSLDPRLISLDGHVLAGLPTTGLLDFAGGIAAGYIFCRVSSRAFDESSTVPVLARWSAFGAIAAIGLVATFPSTFYDGLPFGWPLRSLLNSMLILSAALGSGPYSVTTILESKIPRFIGMISYSFYLVHDLILWLVFGPPSADPAATSNPANYLKAAAALGLTILVAYLSYRVIERRFFEPMSAARARLTP